MKYFKTDGIRGKANKHPITSNFFQRIGESLNIFKEKNIIVSHDTRSSSISLSYSIISSLLSINKNVIYKGVCPTPSIIYESKKLNTLGIIITASHNPYYDNGIKIVYKGLKIDDNYIKEIEDYLNNENKFIIKNNFGNLINNYNLEYDKLIKQMFIYNNNCLYDLANGSSIRYSNLFINTINNNPNGININQDCGSTNIFKMQEYLKNTNYDLLYSFDGDADRLLMCSKNKIYNGNHILFLLAKYFKDNHLLNNNKIVSTIICNPGLKRSLKKINIELIEVNVGDLNVLKYMLDNNLNLGGEPSGHIITPYNLTSDGIITSQIINKILLNSKSSLDNLLKDLNLDYEENINLKLKNNNLINHEKIINLKNEFNGKIIIRKSGTEDLIRLYLSSNINSIKIFKDKFYKTLVELGEKLDKNLFL